MANGIVYKNSVEQQSWIPSWECQVGYWWPGFQNLSWRLAAASLILFYPNWVWFDRCLFEKYSMFLVALKMAESVCFWVHEIWYYMTVSVDSQAFIV